jgi:hypothetical protein
MGDGFGVAPADLLAHGNHVHAVADGVEQALAAGRSVRAGGEAYGQLCSMVPVWLGVLQDALLDGVADSLASIRDTGDQVRAAAGTYDSTDRDAAAGVTRSGDKP